MTRPQALSAVFTEVDERLLALERILQHGGELPLSATVDETLGLAKTLLRAYHRDRIGAEAAGAGIDSDDLLEVFKVFVKGDPTLNAVRDNLREMVYYRNCIDMQREDALPPKPANMAVRTARHVYLYLRTRALKEHRLDAD
jgi:hypothetical protein